MINENIEKMIDLAKSKKDYLNEILELTKKQKTYIEEDKINMVESIMLNKDKLMQAIDLLDIDFLSLYNGIKKTKNVDSLDEINLKDQKNIGVLQENIKEINNILNLISIVDKKNTQSMKESLEKEKSGLRQVKEVKKAYKGYNYTSGGSILLDEKK